VSLLDRAIVGLLPAVPKTVVRRLSSRYIAGETLDEGIAVVRELNDAGKHATIDVLGEEVLDAAQAELLAAEYVEVLRAAEREGLEAGVSVKPTALGLALDFEVCLERLERVVRVAAELGNFVRIDMEGSSWTDDTLALYRRLRERGLDNVGVVLQAYLRRTLDDVEALADLVPNVRLCKGIYAEREEIAFQDDDEVRESFVTALDRLFALGSYVGIATHDEQLIGESLRMVEEHGRGPDEYELQMLLGVREARATELVDDGHRLRVYVPYGSDWYGYSLRRLQENPKLAGYAAADLFARLVPGRSPK
jgi:proline dehydrogenase